MSHKKHRTIARIVSWRNKPALFIMIAVLFFASLSQGFGVFAASCSTTADCRQQIANIDTQNAQAQASLSDLAGQASSYQDAVSQLQAQINALSAQIQTNQATQLSLQQQIIASEQKIEEQKGVLASDMKAMYIGGQISPVEMLATSNSLSDYIDQQQAYSAVQDKIQSVLEQIAALQKQLQTQKGQVDQLLEAQKAQNDQLTAAEQKQAELLAYNQAQQADYNQQLANNNAARVKLQAQLAILNTPVGSKVISGATCGGGYPQSTPNYIGVNWGCNHPQDNTIDNWGMYNRECVSYTAFRVHQEYVAGDIRHDMPNWGGIGNAYQWINNAINAGIPVDQTPQAGDIAIRPLTGTYGDLGHAMYVESVVNSSTIIVSQYNASYNGTYSMVSRSSAGLYYLHFAQWQ